MLVLGGGGVLGEAWMTAVLVGIEEVTGFDACRCEGYVGTSAGSIVAAALSAGIDPRSRLGKLPEQPPVPASELPAQPSPFARSLRFGLAAGGVAAAPLAAVGLRSTEAGGALLRRAALMRAPTGRRSLSRLGRELDQDGARWDGRLSSSVKGESGRFVPKRWSVAHARLGTRRRASRSRGRLRTSRMSSRSARRSCSPKARGRDCPPAPHPKTPSLAYGRSLVMTQASTLEQVVRDRLDEMADEELVPLRPFEVLPTSTTSRLVP